MDAVTIRLKSPAFSNMHPIPRRYTGDGEDYSPSLEWSEVPTEVKSFVLICDDPDAPRGDWVHWVIYDLPVSVTRLKEHISQDDTIEGGGIHGITDFRRTGYNGPCPPSGTHRYFFKIYGLDTMLNLPPGKNKKEIEKAMEGHILAKGLLVGTYSRK